ncbi:hypothetical protein [Flavobacterium sp. 14A]|uniref:hypothetical protein n=1 Tax=Flavobacterium sp. 14A TaxID=2735896 RepID=UPI00156D526D|nr:hypothetical protein [Flavobacterium sp. 14A]NRT10964.1 hypothetical protein [Flavobacterium sp. 14A]
MKEKLNLVKGTSFKRLNTLTFVVLLFIGVFSPTSAGGVMNSFLTFIAFGFLFIILSIFVKKRLTKSNVILFLLINGSLIFFTLSGTLILSTYSFGIYPNFLFLSCLFLLDLKNIQVNKSINFFFLICSYLIITLGFGIIFRVIPILNFILDHYTAGYDALLPNMLSGLKPVATFATHSIAALFLFIFFYLNIKAYKSFKKNIYLLTAVLFLLLLLFIRSNSALVFISFSFLILFKLFVSNKSSLIYFALLVILIIIYFGFIDDSVILFLKNFDISSILSSDKNGLQGRYSSASPLQVTMDYILSNPFSPLGLTYSDKLYYSDSGFILYFLRGSIFLMFGIYFGFILLIKNNLCNNREAYFFIFITLLFEIGYPVLLYIRFIYFIPFYIVYSNHLDTSSNES